MNNLPVLIAAPARYLAFARPLAMLSVLVCTAHLAPVLQAQGCIAARHMALSLGPDGIQQLQPGQWQVGSSLRYLYADEGWRGTDYWPDYATIVGNRITIVSVDTQVTYAFSPRLTATLTVPWQYGQTSNYPEHDGTRHTVNAHGLGDLRLVGTTWLFDPATHARGNISLGLGLKLPTGDDAATAIFHKPTGLQTRPVDVSIQPGDGGWGVILELSAYRQLTPRLYAYANGYYLANPKETNSGYPPNAVYGTTWNSVADQYLFRTGLTLARWPTPHLSASLGLRINGIPPFDWFGGSAGFRRPGYVTYIEPGLTWSSGLNDFSLFVPVRLDANRLQNVTERPTNTPGGGAFARYLVVTSFSHRF